MDFAQSLRPFFPGFSSQRVAQNMFAYFRIAESRQVFVQITGAGLIPCLQQFQAGPVRMDVNGRTARFMCVLHEIVTFLVVIAVIGIFPDRLSEEFRKLCPVGYIRPLVQNPGDILYQFTQRTGLADKKEVVVFIPRRPMYIGLHPKDQLPDRVHMLSGYKVVRQPSTLVYPKLEQAASPPGRIEQVRKEVQEPGGFKHFPDGFVRLAVTAELYLRRQHGRLSFFKDGREVSIEQDGIIQVV
ncbi:hypothetical protein M096_4635 [Parabacteroides distasonis str. 3999B T(B) 6]|nr:hypothetical protein M095_3462 [Parabacteroides distasonis str. 3999B T(B) 4]KDS65635.1 hypothetical protein M096_4635 [Parabacteroides distasonis str. 3999B T(B) 6]